MDRSKFRHILKAITWRIIASTTTFSLALFFFGRDEIVMASWLALLETGIKILIFYFHERIWFKIPLSINHRLRHILKALTWRIVASGTTFALALLLFEGHDDAFEKATTLAVIESVLKMIFYYGHEEAWYRINFGLYTRKEISK